MNTKISIFSATISHHPFLSRDQERTASKEELILSNLRFVMSIAKKYTNDSDEYEDLVSEGMIGLITAAEKYVYQSGCSFGTYANFWIRSSIRRAKYTIHNTIRVPETYMKKHPDYVRVTSSFDDHIDGSEKENTNYDIGSGTSKQSVEDTICNKEEIEQIRAQLKKLDHRECDILCRTSGIGYDKEQSFSEVGKVYGICKERVRQIRNTAAKKMRICLEKA